ncbi:MAG: hypothetical protein K9I94_13780 [Bacteroidales bacterium]|nr:hypothetical protein [Bacteroidales bacterium]
MLSICFAKARKCQASDEYDNGSRFYDAQLGRWHVVDPKAGINISCSPYSYVKNNPIFYLGPNGKWDVNVHLFKDREKFGYGVAIIKKQKR